MQTKPNQDDIQLAEKAAEFFVSSSKVEELDIKNLSKEIAAYRIKLIQDYEEVIADHKRLVRELDVIWNGKEGAAKQASLCDIVNQIASDLAEGELLPCCGTFPELVWSTNDYPNSRRYQCPKCKRTTMPCYSTLGNTIQMAAELWNKNLKEKS